jgi:hypothetical protein
LKPYFKKAHHKKGPVEWLNVYALTSNPVPQKKKRKKKRRDFKGKQSLRLDEKDPHLLL